MSQAAGAAGPPGSYHTNVNRAKTKKWVEAKSYSYDGDDWGEVDDYDEYGGYDETQPEPAPRPTGLRQRGQSASKTPQENYGPRQDIYQSPVDARQQYGTVGGPSQQQHGGRSATNSQSQQPPAMGRTDSFDRGDERRGFSSGGQQQNTASSSSGPYPNSQTQSRNIVAQDFQPAQMYANQQGQFQQNPTGPPLQIPNRTSMDSRGRYGDYPQSAGASNRGVSHPEKQRQQNTGSRAQSMTSNSSSLDVHNRRDFSPSAMPPPLQTRGSPSPHGNPDSRSSSWLPPRKSSLTQDNPPSLPFLTQAPSMPAAEDGLSSSRNRSASNTSNPPTLIRPADIYRRMQEEKERERQSQEFSRPNLDTVSGRPNGRPAVSKIQDNESSQRLKPALDPVTERKSEYGIEGFDVNDQTPPGEKRSTTSKKFELPKRAPDSYSQASTSSLGPMLPDVSRMSGFGESFGHSFLGGGDGFGESTSTPTLNHAESSSAHPARDAIQVAPEKDLKNQPSLGFTSAVHQAFDKAEDHVPPTPSSAYASTVGRSTSGGTSTVSPIISRGPSTATDNLSTRLPGIDDVSTPTIAEGIEGSNSKPLSSESLGTPKQILRKPSPSFATPPPPMEIPPSSFIPGHRRDLSTPSPDNSPARTPAMESTRQLRQPQEVEMAAATPTDPEFNTDSSSESSNVAPEERPAYGPSSESYSQYKGRNSRDMDAQPSARNFAGKADQLISPISTRGRTDSSSSSRVRDLADKFESGSRPGSAHSTTPRASMFGNTVPKKDEFAPPRPLVDRNESFRPHLPGGWESSASIAPVVGLSRLDPVGGQQQPEMRKPVSFAQDAPKDLREPIYSMAEQQPSSVSQIKDASEEAFTAVAAAGAALAGAFGAAIGIEHHESPTDSTAKAPLNEQQSLRKSEALEPTGWDGNVSANTRTHPDASRPFMPMSSDNEMSSAAPTPRPHIIHHQVGASPTSPDYYPNSPSRDPFSESRNGPSEETGGVKSPSQLPPLSTDLQPHQYESDRLRKEIVKELTPMSASEPTTAETEYSDYNNISRLSTTPSVRPDRESGVLPREYESYWNDANSDDEMEQFSREPSQVENATAAGRQPGAAPASEHPQPELDKHSAPSGSIVSEDPSQDKPHTIPHRFSWEKPLENLSQKPGPAQEQPTGLTSMFLKSSIYPEGTSFQPQAKQSAVDQSFVAPTINHPSLNESPKLHGKYSPKPASSDISGLEKTLVDNDEQLPSYLPGLETGPSVPEKGFEPSGYASNPDEISQHSPNLRSEPREELEAPLPELPRQQLTPGFDVPPSPPPLNAQPKIPTFREILALRTPTERIRGYDSARGQFAMTDTGLAQWLAATVNGLPEYADLLASSGRVAPNLLGHKPSPSRSKLGGLLPNQSTASDGTATGAPLGGGSTQGFSPSSGSGNKISSQQVQAKGKDLLHTAGVFGGKANVAAKGLFSKGKSKLRAASGTEKGTTPKSEPLSRGMQPQPEPPNPPEQPAEHSKAIPQATLPESQHIPQPSDRNSPRDTPSLESVTPSNEGDDERSEDSVPTTQKLPLRLSSLPEATQQERVSAKRPVTIGDSAPIFLRETPRADSYVGSPKDIQTPRSATSSNKTPTQSNFKDLNHPTTSQSPRSNVDSTDFQYRALAEAGASGAPESQPRSLSPPHSRFSTQLLHEHNAATPSTGDSSEEDYSQRFSEESKGTFHTADSAKGHDDRRLLAQDQPNSQSTEIDRLMSRAPERLSALRQSSVSKSTPLQISGDNNNPAAGFSKTRLVSPIYTPQRTLRPSQDHSLRAPSIDGLPSPVSPYHPPPPVTPPQSTVRERSEQRGREGPVHYGIDHDFVPESDRERARSRSPSYTNLAQNGSPHDSRPSYDPNIDDHPAFRKSEDIDDGSRRRSMNKPSSRRGSRSSAFFKALGKSSDGDAPPLPKAPDGEASSTPINTPTAGDKKRRSMSIFRSLTGNSGSGSGSLQSKENVTPTRATAQPQYTRTEPITPQRVEDDEFPMRDTQSKWGKRLQRASTSGITPDSSKKKRFSAIGSLFGRGNQKRQSSSEITQMPFNQAPPVRRQQPDPYNTTTSAKPSHSGRRPPVADYSPPPPGGYYAPGRAEIDPRVDNAYSAPNSRSQQNRRPSSQTPDAPAYVQDSYLRQQTSPTSKGRKASTVRSSVAFSHRSPQPSTSSVPQSSSIRQVSSRESRPERSTHESQPSGGSWTRFSTRARSKSRSSQPPQPPLNGLTSPHPTTYEYAPASRSSEMFRRSFHETDRTDSPPPPPPPPKDDWHKPRPRDSTSGGHSQNPSQSSTRPLSSTHNRQSLPPLQTNVASDRNSAVRSGKTLTPEEKRESRRVEIERSTLSPAAAAAAAAAASPVSRPVRETQEEHIQMSATSFPGQLWQPEYAHWDGD